MANKYTMTQAAAKRMVGYITEQMSKRERRPFQILRSALDLEGFSSTGFISHVATFFRIADDEDIWPPKYSARFKGAVINDLLYDREADRNAIQGVMDFMRHANELYPEFETKEDAS